jgi:endogenous inhibitor of DNA gyrase (YacG/DUF329 family)
MTTIAKRIIKTCEICGKETEYLASQVIGGNRGRFCSNACKFLDTGNRLRGNKYRLGHKQSKETRQKRSQSMLGKNIRPKTEEHRQKISQSLTGRKRPAHSARMKQYYETHEPSNRGEQIELNCLECGKTFIIPEYKVKLGSRYCSKQCHYKHMRNDNYYDNLYGVIKKSPEWKEWREGVYERDNYTCQLCGVKGQTLNPHHIKPVVEFPEETFNPDNGVTVCVHCHKRAEIFFANEEVGYNFD